MMHEGRRHPTYFAGKALLLLHILTHQPRQVDSSFFGIRRNKAEMSCGPFATVIYESVVVRGVLQYLIIIVKRTVRYLLMLNSN